MRRFKLLPVMTFAAAAVATAFLLSTTSRAVPPEKIMDTAAEGIVDVAADMTVPGVGTLRVHNRTADGETGSVVLQSRTPGQNFPALNIPFVLIGDGNMDRTVRLGKTEIVDQGGTCLAIFVLSRLSDNRATVKDQLLLLQRLPFFDTPGTEDGPDLSLADAVVNFVLNSSQPDVSALAPDDPLRDLFGNTIRVTQAKVAGALRGSRGNERYSGRWTLRWSGHIEGGVHDGKDVRGRITIRFVNTAEPVVQLPQSGN